MSIVHRALGRYGDPDKSLPAFEKLGILGEGVTTIDEKE
jgi:hypothetical protein